MKLPRALLLAYLSIFLAALAVRVAIVFAMQDVPLARVPVLDSQQYFIWARWILEGRWPWPQPWAQGPGYPMLLAALLAAGGGSLMFVAIAQSVLGAVSAAVTAAIANRWFGMRAAVGAGLIQAVYMPLAFAETSLLVEGPFVLAISVFVLCIAPFDPRSGQAIVTARRVLIAGALIGAAAIIRSTALPLAIAFALLLWLDSRGPLPRARGVAFFLAGLLAITLPVAALNASQGGGWRLQGKGGVNFWIGNTIEGDGTASFRLGRGWDRAEGDADRAGVTDVAQHDRYYLTKTFREIAGAPGRWLLLLAQKAVWSLQREEIRDSLAFGFFAREVRWLGWLPGFAVLLPLAALGLVHAIRERVMPRPLTAWLVVAWLTLILLVVGYRYRLPLVPPLAILGGFGLAALFELSRAGRFMAVAILVAAAVAAESAAMIWRHAPSRVFAEELTYTGDLLQNERRFTEAEAKYREALAADRQSALAWKGLGMRFYNVGRLDEARTALRQAVTIDPMYADAWMRLAWTEGRERRYGEAIAHMRRAAEIYPRDLAIRRYLARYLFEAGDFAAAIPEFERVVTGDPRDQEAAGLLEMARRRVQ